MDKMARGFVALASSLTCAVAAFAGIPDSPLPVLQAGVKSEGVFSLDDNSTAALDGGLGAAREPHQAQRR